VSVAEVSPPTLAGGVAIAVLIVVLAVIVGGVFAIRAPLMDPPGFGVRLGLYLRTNIAETGPEPALPELAPLILIGNTEMALHAISQTAFELGWREVAVDKAGAELRAVVVSSVFRFSDDIHIRLLVRSADRTEAAVRSSSRVGRGDLGANVHHIMALREALRRRAVLAEDGI